MSYCRLTGLPALALGLTFFAAGALAQDVDRMGTFERAQELAAQGSYRAAIELFSLVRDPFRDEEIALGTARARAAVGEYELAIAALDAHIDGDDPADHPVLATELAEQYRNIGQSARALEILEAVIEGNTTPPVRSIVQYADLLHFTGRRDEAAVQADRAIARYQAGMVFDSEGVAMVARANQLLNRFHQANSLYSEAVRIDPENVEAQVLWGDLFQEKFNEADAEESYADALDVNRRYTPALVGMAGISQPERNLQRALDINPQDVKALTRFGDLLIRNERREEGIEFLERALDVNPEALEALARLAAVAAMQEEMQRFAELETRVNEFSPDNPEFYAIIAEHFGNNYRFTEAVQYARQSVAADERYWHGHTVLGNNLVRLGEEEEGRAHLELAFDNDPFNVLTSNLLQVFDTLDGYATLETEHFRVNMSHRDALILWPYMESMLEESWDILVERYQFEPEVPVILQVFENTQDFAVRSVGLPDIGPLVGICFGKVVTLISPDTLDANWQEILWHELVHVFTLQMTQNRMPRWLSEGISTWEEQNFRPEWGRRQGLELIRAVQNDRLLHVGELNSGFSGARSNADLSFAYFQSYLVVEFIAEHHGFDKLLDLIHEYAHIREDAERFQNVFAMSLDEFNAGFRDWIEQQVEEMDVYVHVEDGPDEGAGHGHGVRENNSAVLAELYNNTSLIRHMQSRIENNPRDFQAHLQLGIVLFKEDRYTEALHALGTAHEILPDYTGYPSPPLVMSQIYEALGDRQSQLAQLEVLLENQQHDYSSVMILAADALEREDLERAEYYIDRALGINPYRLDVHRMAADVARQREQRERAVQEFEIIAALDRNDPVDAGTNLAQAYLENAQAEEARRTILQALETAPTYRRAQEVLLQTVEEVN